MWFPAPPNPHCNKTTPALGLLCCPPLVPSLLQCYWWTTSIVFQTSVRGSFLFHCWPAHVRWALMCFLLHEFLICIMLWSKFLICIMLQTWVCRKTWESFYIFQQVSWYVMTVCASDWIEGIAPARHGLYRWPTLPAQCGAVLTVHVHWERMLSSLDLLIQSGFPRRLGACVACLVLLSSLACSVGRLREVFEPSILRRLVYFSL